MRFGLYYGGYYPYAHNDYYDEGGCYLVRRRLMTLTAGGFVPSKSANDQS